MKTMKLLLISSILLLVYACGENQSATEPRVDEAMSSDQDETVSITNPGTDTAHQESLGRTDVPMIGETLLAAAPEGWHEAFASNAPSLRMAEFIPSGESDESWTQKITFESSAGQPLPDPIEFVKGISQDQSGTCEGFEAHSTFSGFENGYPTSVHLLVCFHSKIIDKSQVTLMKAIQGNEQFYVITRSLRGPPLTPGETAISPEEIAGWSLYLRAISVCDSERVEHPCPK